MHDLILVGAGPVGATLALALAGGGLDVLALDGRVAGTIARGDRSLALSHGSRLIFERLGVWQALAARPDAVTPITTIDVSQRGGFGSASLNAADEGLPALGYVASYRALQGVLDDAVRAAGIDVRYSEPARRVRADADSVIVETGDSAAVNRATFAAADDAVHAEGGSAAAAPYRARLAVLADGSGELADGAGRVRHDYRQTAVVAKVWTREPHAGVAYERFTPEGPMALLPEGDHYGLVWTATPGEAERLLALGDADFLSALQQRFGTRVRGFERAGARRAFPLRLEFARRVAQERVILIGNAAQALHPVAGQGFNLGLRDAYELAQELLCCERTQLGERSQLQRYERARRLDRGAGIGFTHAVLRAFGNDSTLLRWPRGLALTLLDSLPPMKHRFTRSMLFGWR